MIGRFTMPNSVRIKSIEEVGEILRSFFEKHQAGEYFSHLNGSDIVIQRKSTMRWDWSVDGRVHVTGSSNSLNVARGESWIATLNPLEKRAFHRGELPIP
jgi:hypothetical protein